MNLRDLEYLLAVADSGHFGKAARRCGVSQPTLSMQLKKLEGELGVVLFERGVRPAQPTAAGHEVVREARAILAAAARLKEIARQRADPLTGLVRLGVIPTLGPYLLPVILAPIRERFPGLQLHLVEQRTERLLAELRRGELDAAILSPPFDTAGIDRLPLGAEGFLIALPPGHRLAARPALGGDDLRDERVLCLEEGHCLTEQVAQVLRALGVEPAGSLRASGIETLRQMVSVGMGLAVLPALAGQGPFAQAAPLVLRPIAGLRAGREVALAWRATSPLAAALRRLGGTMAEIMPRT
jgi:LysR family hydrogen peroxide-inducible transcriptional activator